MLDEKKISCEKALTAIQSAVLNNQEILASDILVERLDNLFLKSNLEEAEYLMVNLNIDELPPKVLSGALMIGWHARAELKERYDDFFKKVYDSLTRRFGKSLADSIYYRYNK